MYCKVPSKRYIFVSTITIRLKYTKVIFVLAVQSTIWIALFVFLLFMPDTQGDSKKENKAFRLPNISGVIEKIVHKQGETINEPKQEEGTNYNIIMQ